MTNASQEQFEQAVEAHRAGDLLTAERLYDSLLDSIENHAGLRHLAGTLQLQRGCFDEAVLHLRHAVDLQPDDSQSHNNLGVALQSLGNWEEAARSFEATIKLDPGNAEAFYNLGRIMQARGLPRDASKCFERALDLQPDSPETLTAYADCLIADEQWENAEQVIHRLDSSPQSDSHTTGLRRALLNLQRGNLSSAESEYRQLLSQAPNDIDALNNLAVTLEQSGKFEQAIQCVEQALRHSANDPRLLTTHGTIQRSLQHWSHCEASFESAAQSDSSQIRPTANLSVTRLLRGDWMRGWKSFSSWGRHVTAANPTATMAEWDGQRIARGELVIWPDVEPAECLIILSLLGVIRQQADCPITLVAPSELHEICRLAELADKLEAPDSIIERPGASIRISQIPALLKTAGPLRADPALRTKLTARHRESPDTASESRVVGIVWHNDSEFRPGNIRCCPIEILETILEQLDTDVKYELLAAPGSATSQLQRFFESGLLRDAREIVGQPKNWPVEFERLTGIIGVDSPLTRLLATTGLPTQVLVTPVPHWSWQLDSEDSVCYQSASIHRQSEWNSWEDAASMLVQSVNSIA